MGVKAPLTLSASAVCAIINACAKNGVAKLKYGDLELEFLNKSRTAEHTFYSGTEDQSDPAKDFQVTHDATPASEQSLQSKLSTVDPELLDDMRRSQLMIEDPLSYEQEMIDLQIRGPENDARSAEHDRAYA